MKIKDAEVLKFFNMDPKKAVTPAKISMQYLPIVNDAKFALMDEELNNEAKTSHTKNLDNAAFKIAALALYQESKKGMPNGYSSVMQPFFNKTNIDPAQLFSVNNQDAEKVNSAIQFAFGGQLKKYGLGDPVLKEVGVQYDVPDLFSALPKEEQDEYLGYFNNNKDLANQYLYIESLDKKPGFKEALFKKYQTVSKDDKAFGKNYIKNKEKIISNDPQVVFVRFADSQFVNLQNKAYGLKSKDIGKKHDSGVYGNTTKNYKDFANKYGIDATSHADDVAKEQLSYLAFNELVKDQGNKEYSEDLKGVLSPFEAIKEGEGDETTGGVKGSNLSRADGFIGDTWALQTAKFREKKPITPTPSTDKPREAIPYQPLITQPRPEVPFDFRREDKASIQRAFEAKNAIQKYMPWAKVPGVTTTESAYFSPERAIAATNEQLAQGIAGVNAFATPQQAAAAITQMQGKAFGQVADVIGNYADKNVGIFNQTEQQNTALANSAAQQSAQMQTSNYDKQTIAKQQYNNSLQAAKDKITQLTNQAWTNASNIFNLNKIQKQFIKDPYTGLITQFADKPFDVSKESAKTIAEEYMSFKNQLPGVDDKTAFNLFKATKTGKYDVAKEPGQIETASGSNEEAV